MLCNNFIFKLKKNVFINKYLLNITQNTFSKNFSADHKLEYINTLQYKIL